MKNLTIRNVPEDLADALEREKSRRRESLNQTVIELLSQVVGVDAEVSRHYAAIYVDLRRAGTPITTNDIWIAAAAAREGAMVVSYDDHFRAISRVGSVILRE